MTSSTDTVSAMSGSCSPVISTGDCLRDSKAIATKYNFSQPSHYLCINPYRRYLCHHSHPPTVLIMVHLIPQILVCLVNLMGSLQINKAKHIVINMVSHMELHPLACMPIRTVVPLVISRAHYVVVRPPTNASTNAPTNMTPIIVACMYLQCSSSLEDIRADVTE